MLEKARQLKPRLVELRRTIHRNPELGFNVEMTAKLVASTLRNAGLQVKTGVGKTGVIAHIGDSPGPIVAIRADMDALPITEENVVEYASQNPGKMHACGHDAHTAILMGVGLLLAQEKLPGKIRLLFQPSEETFDGQGVSGATRMIADGALEGVNAVLALHVNGSIEVGKISVESGPISAAVDSFEAHIIGKGGHGAHPDQTIDPIWLTAQVLNALYAIPSRRINPFEPSVLSIGEVRGGTATNVIPNSIFIQGTMRSMSAETRIQLTQELQACFEIARIFGGNYTLKIDHGYPVMNCDPQIASVIHQSGIDLLGRSGVVPWQKTMGAEDFSYMCEICPGAMFDLGVQTPGTSPRHLHTPHFDLDKNALPVGAAVLAKSALRLLRNPSLQTRDQ